MKWQDVCKKLEDKGILLSVADISSVTGLARGTVNKILDQGRVLPCGKSTGKRYFSEDVAKAIVSFR